MVPRQPTKQYRREDLGEGVRGKHHSAYMRGTNLILLQPAMSKKITPAKIRPHGKVVEAQQRLPFKIKTPNAETVAA